MAFVQAHFSSPHSSRRLASLAASQIAAFAAKNYRAQFPQTSEPARRLDKSLSSGSRGDTLLPAVDNVIGFPNTYPLDSDLSGG